MNAISRDPIRTTDADGTPVVRVPLAKGRGVAVLHAKDFDELMRLGITRRWNRNVAGPGYSYVRCKPPRGVNCGTLLSVSRLIMEAPPGMCVRYRDDDRFNLRQDNLYLAEDGRAQGRERSVMDQMRQRQGQAVAPQGRP